ncbi:MAG: hypothetical protein CMH79_03800 [Nitrospinae bacterium]|nr:hypothetical protein [Nitrospinota bacterium]|tara:strand:+ start:120 stop:1004 length:885 start_codon:yes stop_codon:yes gene_type:complete
MNIKVGVVGLGNMGSGIAHNFIEKGISLKVWDSDKVLCKKYEKKKNVELMNPTVMSECCNVVFFVVPSCVEVGTYLNGRDSMLSNPKKGLIIYDLTSSDPKESSKLAKKAKRKGVDYLDAGMSGGATGAKAGTLTLMIGGDKKAFNKSKKILSFFVRNPFYLGKSGSGHTLKLIHNMVCHSIFLSTCEGGKMAERAGINLKDMIDVFNVANARSYASQFRFPLHILSEKWDAKSRVYNLHKDVGMAVALGKSMNAQVDLGESTLTFLKKAMSFGMQDTDYSLLYKDFENIRKEK